MVATGPILTEMWIEDATDDLSTVLYGRQPFEVNVEAQVPYRFWVVDDDTSTTTPEAVPHYADGSFLTPQRIKGLGIAGAAVLGVARGTWFAITAGKRKEAFAVKLGTVFDLVNAPVAVITDPALINAAPNTIDDANVTSRALEVVVQTALPEAALDRHVGRVGAEIDSVLQREVTQLVRREQVWEMFTHDRSLARCGGGRVRRVRAPPWPNRSVRSYARPVRPSRKPAARGIRCCRWR